MKKIKKIVGMLLAAVLSVGMAVSASAADEAAKESTIGNLASVRVETVLGEEIAVLNKSVSISKTLEVAENGFLVIPSGKTLILKNGAEIDGDVYIENGGTLTFSAGKAEINGSVVSDGKVRIKDDASVWVGGTLYVSPTGRLSVGEKSILERKARSDGNIVCLGRTDSERVEIAKKPIAAVIVSTDPYTGEMIWAKSVTDGASDAIPGAIVPDPTKYYTDDIPVGSSTNRVYLFFENGALIDADKLGKETDEKNYTKIAGVWIKGALAAIERE